MYEILSLQESLFQADPEKYEKKLEQYNYHQGELEKGAVAIAYAGLAGVIGIPAAGDVIREVASNITNHGLQYLVQDPKGAAVVAFGTSIFLALAYGFNKLRKHLPDRDSLMWDAKLYELWKEQQKK